MFDFRTKICHTSRTEETFMASVTASPAKSVPAYPAANVAVVLQDELLRAVRAGKRRKGHPMPPADATWWFSASKSTL